MIDVQKDRRIGIRLHFRRDHIRALLIEPIPVVDPGQGVGDGDQLIFRAQGMELIAGLSADLFENVSDRKEEQIEEREAHLEIRRILIPEQRLPCGHPQQKYDDAKHHGAQDDAALQPREQHAAGGKKTDPDDAKAFGASRDHKKRKKAQHRCFDQDKAQAAGLFCPSDDPQVKQADCRKNKGGGHHFPLIG